MFEFDGEKYRRFSKMQKEIGTKLIEELELKGDEKILDLGCGDGVLTYHLSKLVPNGKVIGIDASYGMIRIAKEYESKNLIFLLLDINNISFYEEFDVIFSNAALHWVKDHEKLLQNCYKALKKDGYIRFNFACHGNCQNFIEVVKMTMNSNRFKKYFSQFDWPWYMPEIYEYKKLLKNAGFVDYIVWEENADRYFTKEELIGWIEQPTIVPFLNCLDENEKESFRSEVISKMIDITKKENELYFETFRRINVEARK